MSYIKWLRRLIGSQKAIIVYTSIILQDPQGRVLLQRRTDMDIWGLPGGILEPGETLLVCAQRELFEESGLTAGEMRLVGVYSEPCYDAIYPNGDQVQQYTVCFQALMNGGEMRVDGVETSALAFMTPDEIPYTELPIFYQAMLRDALNKEVANGCEPAFMPPAFMPPVSNPQLINPIEQVRPLIGNALYVGAGAIAVVQRSDGKLLVVRRVDNGEWSLPGGFLHLGENASNAAQREVLEETGLYIQIQRLMGVFSPAYNWVYPNGDQVHAVVSVFKASPTGGREKADHVETSQVGWMHPQELAALSTLPILKELNQAVTAHLDQGTFIH